MQYEDTPFESSRDVVLRCPNHRVDGYVPCYYLGGNVLDELAPVVVCLDLAPCCSVSALDGFDQRCTASRQLRSSQDVCRCEYSP